MTANKTISVIICVLLQFIINESCFAQNEKLYILNSSLFVEDNEVAVLSENQKASYYELGNLYLILIYSYNLHENYSFLYDAQKNQKIYLEINVATHIGVYFWNSILIYWENKKIGACVLFDTINQNQTLFHEWFGGFYIINDELCIRTKYDEYKCLTNDKRYNINTKSNKLTALERKEVDVLYMTTINRPWWHYIAPWNWAKPKIYTKDHNAS
jgi:hypothetical protein